MKKEEILKLIDEQISSQENYERIKLVFGYIPLLLKLNKWQD